MNRRLLLVAVVILLGFNWVGWTLQHAGFWPPQFSAALSTVGEVVAVLALLFWQGQELRRTNDELQLAVAQQRDAVTKYRSLFEQSPHGIVVVDPVTNRFIEFNEAAWRDLGYSLEEFSRLSFADVVLGCSPAEFRSQVDRVCREGRGDFEGCQRTKKGELRNVWLTAQRIEVSNRPAYRVQIRDITERKNAETALIRRTAFLEAMVDSALDGILVVDSQGRKIYQNQRAIDLWKIPPSIAADPDDTRQAEFAASRTKCPREFNRKVAQLYAHTEESSRDELELIDGTVLDRFSSPVRDRQGNYYGRIWTFRDNTERKAAEAALLASEDRFRALAETIDDVFWITDSIRNKVLYVSPAYEKVWGRTSRSLYANPDSWLGTVHETDRERVLHAITARGSNAGYDEEYRIVRPDGGIRWIRDRAFPDFGVDGEIERIVGVARDITERRQLQEQLRQSQKLEAIGQLAGGIAHDFNNILSVIEGHVSLLVSEDGLTGVARESVNEISLAAKRAAGLTRQLLAFGRRQIMQPRVLNLNVVIEGILRMLRRILGEHVTLSFSAGSHPPLLADPGMLEQVLINLAVNARDAMPNGGNLDIRTGASSIDEGYVAQHPEALVGRFVWFEVADTGCGISPENLPKVFEPFFTTKDVGKGTGLGLATVYGIVKQHRGWMTVQSEVKRGTVFTIHLPAAEAAGDEFKAIDTSPASESITGGTECILLVEDEPGVLNVTRTLLERHGYRVVAVTSGTDALREWKKYRSRIDLLLTDAVMPGEIGGQQLAERLGRENPRLRVVCMSGHSPELSRFPSRSQCGRHFLPKPFSSYQLLLTIRRCLDEVEPGSNSETRRLH